MNRTLQSVIAIAVILAGGFGLWQLILASEPEAPSAPPRDVGAPRVAFHTLVPRHLTIEIQAFGNLKATHRVELAAELSGRVVEVFDGWQPGAEVSAGQLLLRLDETLFKLDLASAQAALGEAEAALQVVAVEEQRARVDQRKLTQALDLARRQYERMVELGQVASDVQRDTAESNKLNAERSLELADGALAASAASEQAAQARRATAQAAVARAEELLLRCTLRAPFSGRLRGHAPGLGTMASPGKLLAELVDPSSIVLQLHVPERDLLLIKPGMRTQLVFPNTPETDEGRTWAGMVSAVDIASDPLTRRGLVEIKLEDSAAQRQLPSGLFARAMIEVEQIKDALWIDRRHILWEGSQAVAYVLGHSEAGPELPLAKRRVLTLWREHGEGFVVSAGLQAGERLITQPLDRLQEDAAVLLTSPLSMPALSPGDATQ